MNDGKIDHMPLPPIAEGLGHQDRVTMDDGSVVRVCSECGPIGIESADLERLHQEDHFYRAIGLI